MNEQHLTYREHVLPDDCEHVRQIVASSGFFSEAEIAMAVELVRERLTKGLRRSGYNFGFVQHRGAVVGYTCFGPIAGTVSSYDIYWIAVLQSMRGYGIGQTLLDKAEQEIVAQGGGRIYVETSSRQQYASTRAFYKRCGYHREAVLKNFYAPGEGKMIFVKVIKKTSPESWAGDRQLPQFFLSRRQNWNWIEA